VTALDNTCSSGTNKCIANLGFIALSHDTSQCSSTTSIFVTRITQCDMLYLLSVVQLTASGWLDHMIVKSRSGFVKFQLGAKKFTMLMPTT